MYLEALNYLAHYSFQLLLIAQVGLVEGDGFSRHLLDPLQTGRRRSTSCNQTCVGFKSAEVAQGWTLAFHAIAEVVNSHDVVVLLQQLVNAVRADIAGPSRHENRLSLSAHGFPVDDPFREKSFLLN